MLPLLASRETRFEETAADAVDYLMGLWPDDLRDVRFGWATMPPAAAADIVSEVPHWSVDRPNRRIVLYRIPIQRLLKLHIADDWHRKVAIESCVFRAAAEFIGRDPWEIAPDRYHHH